MATIEAEKDPAEIEPNNNPAGTIARSSRSPRKDATDNLNLVPQCTESSCCVSERDDQKFQCNTCKREVHYRCTGLPLYQIYQFTTKNYRNFICKTCTQVPEHLNNVIPRPPAPVETQEISILRTTVKQTQLEVDTLAETNRLLQGKIKELTVAIKKIGIQRNKDKVEHDKILSDSKVLKAGIKSYEEKIIDYKRVISEKGLGVGRDSKYH